MKARNGHRKNEDLKELFNGKNRKTSIIMMANWFVNIFIFYGLIFVIPYTLQQHYSTKSNPFSKIQDLYWGFLIEFLGLLLTYIAADSIFGRIYSLAISSFLISLSMLFTFFFSYEWFIFYTSLGRLFVNI